MKNFLYFFFFSLLFFASSQSFSEQNKKDIKKVCKEAKAQVQDLQKKLDQLESEKAALNQKFSEAHGRFEKYRTQLEGMRGCSKGNPANTAECTRVLQGLDQAGTDMTQIDHERDSLGPKKLAIENEMFKPQGQIQVHHCE